MFACLSMPKTDAFAEETAPASDAVVLINVGENANVTLDTTNPNNVTTEGVVWKGLGVSGHEYSLYIADNENFSRPNIIKTTESEYFPSFPIPGAKLEYYGVDGYMYAYKASEKYKTAFSALADESRYPVYVHCNAGADRTGTICAIIEALLGMSEEDILHDYETTSFSVYGIRGYNEKTYPFDKFWDKFNTYEGETLADKAENYMLSIGVTKSEIYNIRAIMYGEKTIQSN